MFDFQFQYFFENVERIIQCFFFLFFGAIIFSMIIYTANNIFDIFRVLNMLITCKFRCYPHMCKYFQCENRGKYGLACEYQTICRRCPGGCDSSVCQNFDCCLWRFRKKGKPKIKDLGGVQC